MQIRKLIVDDNKIEIHGVEDGKRTMIRRCERNEDLHKALQRLKPLLLDKCELSDDGDNPVQMTQLFIGDNSKGPFCRLGGVRGLRRGALKLKTPRLSFKKHLSPLQVSHVHAVIKAAQLWIKDQQQNDSQTSHVTALLLQREEEYFLEQVL